MICAVRHIAIFILFVLLMCSCGARKNTYSYSLDEERIRRIESMIEEQQKIISVWTDRSELFENVEVVERFFDTSAEPDSSGRYPVKKEVVTKKESGKKNNIEGKIEEDVKTESLVTDELKEDVSLDSELKEEKKESKISNYLFCFVTLFVVVGIFLLVKKFDVLKIFK